ncbi:MAG: recombinase family protein [Chloroflexi bacterium]|nr:recombinase family protein [Chloroflexota bacterium]
MKAAIYARVSTQDQAREEKVSLKTQISDIEKYCQNKGYEIVEPHYVDIQSGSDTMKNRPQFEKMLKDAAQGLFDVIIAWQPDRLFRSMYPAARLKRTIDETGVNIEAVKQPLDKRMMGLWAWLAEMEIENFKERSRMGKSGVARKGLIVTKELPFGYYVDKNRHPQINEAEACTVRRIFHEFVREDKSVKTIAKNLTKEKVPTRTGQPKFGWSPPYIHKMLRNRTYMGEGEYGKHIYNGTKYRKAPAENIIPIPFPPIVDCDLFEAAQEKKNRRLKSIEHHYNSFFLLRDIAYCRECGYKFLPREHWSHTKRTKSGEMVKQRYDEPYQYYTCYAMFRYHDRFSCRKPISLKANELDNLVWHKVVEIIKKPSVVQRAMGIAQGHDERMEITSSLENAKHQVSELGWKRQKAIELQIRGVITEEDLSIQLKLLKEKFEFFEVEVERLTLELANVEKKQLNLATLDELSLHIKGRISKLTDEERLRLVRLLVHKVWVDGKGGVEIEFAIPESIIETETEAISSQEPVFPLSNRDMHPGDRQKMGRSGFGEILFHIRRHGTSLSQEHRLGK